MLPSYCHQLSTVLSSCSLQMSIIVPCCQSTVTSFPHLSFFPSYCHQLSTLVKCCHNCFNPLSLLLLPGDKKVFFIGAPCSRIELPVRLTGWFFRILPWLGRGLWGLRVHHLISETDLWNQLNSGRAVAVGCNCCVVQLLSPDVHTGPVLSPVVHTCPLLSPVVHTCPLLSPGVHICIVLPINCHQLSTFVYCCPLTLTSCPHLSSVA